VRAVWNNQARQEVHHIEGKLSLKKRKTHTVLSFHIHSQQAGTLTLDKEVTCNSREYHLVVLLPPILALFSLQH
jgi:hypothetical protein